MGERPVLPKALSQMRGAGENVISPDPSVKQLSDDPQTHEVPEAEEACQLPRQQRVRPRARSRPALHPSSRLSEEARNFGDVVDTSSEVGIARCGFRDDDGRHGNSVVMPSGRGSTSRCRLDRGCGIRESYRPRVSDRCKSMKSRHDEREPL